MNAASHCVFLIYGPTVHVHVYYILLTYIDLWPYRTCTCILLTYIDLLRYVCAVAGLGESLTLTVDSNIATVSWHQGDIIDPSKPIMQPQEEILADWYELTI